MNIFTDGNGVRAGKGNGLTSPTTSRSSSFKKQRHHSRTPTMPFENTTRRKPRRWPLVLRFIKGAIHNKIFIPVTLHAIFAGVVVFIDQHLHGHLGLPPSIIPSLSIVVGLMLVFRNQTSYNRFWEGRSHLTTMITSVRNLTRSFVACSYPATLAEAKDTEAHVKLLIALLFATKNHMRADWGAFSDMSNIPHSPHINLSLSDPEYSDLVPPGLAGYEHKGLGLLLEFTILVEAYIKRGFKREWWNAPHGSQLTAQLNNLVDAYGKMETIRLTPVPVAHLIHQKQVLALFGAVLPFATVTEMGWWAIPVTILVVFTLYGIDGIATELEDPFGFDRIDIPLDAIVEDIRSETFVLLDEWRKVGMAAFDDVGEDSIGNIANGDAAPDGQEDAVAGSDNKDGSSNGKSKASAAEDIVVTGERKWFARAGWDSMPDMPRRRSSGVRFSDSPQEYI